MSAHNLVTIKYGVVDRGTQHDRRNDDGWRWEGVQEAI